MHWWEAAEETRMASGMDCVGIKPRPVELIAVQDACGNSGLVIASYAKNAHWDTSGRGLWFNN
jgi:hypothetical protein